LFVARLKEADPVPFSLTRSKWRVPSSMLSLGLAVSLAPGMAAAQSSTGAAASQTAPQAQARPVLTVCADPANLPYSDDHVPGFEARIAALMADDLQADLKYDWEKSYRGFLNRTLLAGACDVMIGVPAALPRVATTRPYYATSYVAVMRASDKRHFTSFDDAWLKDARIGVQLVGMDRAYMPPTSALSLRGLNAHITGYAMRTSSPVPNPQGLIIDAVADGTIDVAFVFGPIAGYFAKLHEDVLRIDKITADPKNPDLTFVFPMSMGVRKSETALRDRLQTALDRHQAEIAAILSDYGIPTVPLPQSTHAELPVTDVAQKVGLPPPVPTSGGN
jgi:quinoprotein dehydrogenase-associated probable ABC transporter substrate-binding protein